MAGFENDLPDQFAIGHGGQPLAPSLQRECTVNNRSNPARFGKPMHRLRNGPPAIRPASRIFPGAKANDGKPLYERDIGGDLGNTPAGEADDLKLSANSHAAGAFVEHIATDEVEYDIAQRTFSNLADLFAEAPFGQHHSVG